MVSLYVEGVGERVSIAESASTAWNGGVGAGVVFLYVVGDGPRVWVVKYNGVGERVSQAVSASTGGLVGVGALVVILYVVGDGPRVWVVKKSGVGERVSITTFSESVSTTFGRNAGVAIFTADAVVVSKFAL